MKYGIASYHRPECKTVKTLMDAGVPAEDIIISVQTEEDLAEYSKRHRVKIIYEPNDCAGGNRNTLLKNIEGDVTLLDDDITSFAYWNGEKFVTDTKTALERMQGTLSGIRDDFAIAGVSPNTNGIIRRSRPDRSYLCLLQGTVLIFRNREILFDEKWKMVEDYEISLRAVRLGETTLRLNDFAANKPQNGTNEGGLHDRYKRGELRLWINRLGAAYKEFKPNREKTGGSLQL